MSHIPFPALLRPISTRHLLALVCLGAAVALPAALARPALAQDQGAATQPAGGAQPGDAAFEDFVRLVDNYYHTARMANYTAAQAYGNQIISGNYDPEMLLDAFNEVHKRRSEQPADLDELMLRWQRDDALSAVATDINTRLNDGRVARATNHVRATLLARK